MKCPNCAGTGRIVLLTTAKKCEVCAGSGNVVMVPAVNGLYECEEVAPGEFVCKPVETAEC